MSTMRAAKTIWTLMHGKVSNLVMQKLLYLSHMLELGAGHAPLVDTPFEAWDYGPVEPRLYQRLKAYGSGHVADVFHAPAYSPHDAQYASIASVVRQLGAEKPAKLVHITHWDGGAWSKFYNPEYRGIIIPDSAILAEFHERSERNRRAAVAG